jgi:hypothetical protein
MDGVQINGGGGRAGSGGGTRLGGGAGAAEDRIVNKLLTAAFEGTTDVAGHAVLSDPAELSMLKQASERLASGSFDQPLGSQSHMIKKVLENKKKFHDNLVKISEDPRTRSLLVSEAQMLAFDGEVRTALLKDNQRIAAAIGRFA